MLLRDQKLEKLFQKEIEITRFLNIRNNPHVPKIVNSEKNYYKMVFVNGISGQEVLGRQLNFETRTSIVLTTLQAIKETFLDGVVNLEYAPKNTIIIPNLKTGKAENVKLIDFGVSFLIDLEGNVELDIDLFEGVINPDLFPPETRGQKGKIKINAEKCLVWSLAKRVIFGWYDEKNIQEADVILKALSDDPEKRCSLEDLIIFIENIEFDKAKITSCISKETLKVNQKMLGRLDTEIMVSESQLNKITDEVSKIKEEDIDKEREKSEKLNQKKVEARRLTLQLTKIANEFINSEEHEYGIYDVVNQLENDLLSEIKSLYYDLKERIDFTDVQTILDSISNFAVPKDSKVRPPLTNMFPKFYRLNSELGMDSRLASSILKLAIEEKYKEETYVFIAICSDGYQMVMFDNNNEACNLLDPLATAVDKKGEMHGSIYRFTREQVAESDNVYEDGKGLIGGKLKIGINPKPASPNIFAEYDPKKDLYYQEIFHQSTYKLVDLSVLIHALDELSKEGDYPSLRDFNPTQLIEQAKIRDYKKVLERSN